jgi:hypothetical protein
VFCFPIDDQQPWIPKFIDGEPQRTAMTNFKQRVRSQVITETITAPQDLAFKLAASRSTQRATTCASQPPDHSREAASSRPTDCDSSLIGH